MYGVKTSIYYKKLPYIIIDACMNDDPDENM